MKKLSCIKLNSQTPCPPRAAAVAIWFLALCLLSLLPNQAQAFYNPQSGHWLTRDPIGEQGGININTFFGNSPVTFIDVDGLQMIELAPAATTFTRFGPLTEFSEVSEPIIRISGSPGETITGTSRPSLQQIPDVVMRPIGPGLLPPVAVTAPQPALQPQKPQYEPLQDTRTQELPPQAYVYRAMTRDKSFPLVGPSRRTLGIRPTTDVDMDWNAVRSVYLVHPKNNKGDFQGLSVSPNPVNIFFRNRPAELIGPILGNKTGPGQSPDPLWRLPRNRIPGYLDYFEDRPDIHGVLHLKECMAFDDFQRIIADTAPYWEIAPLGPFIKK